MIERRQVKRQLVHALPYLPEWVVITQPDQDIYEHVAQTIVSKSTAS